MKKNLILSMLLALFFIFTGCSAINPKKEITLTYVGLPEEAKIVKKLITLFEKENPDVKVKGNYIPQNYDQKIQIMVAGGAPADVMWFMSMRLPVYIENGVLMDLSTFIKTDPTFDYHDFFPITMDLVTVNNKIGMIPRDVCPMVLYYNKDIFDREGLKYPDENWTWNDFLKTAQKLTKNENNDNVIDQYGFCTYYDFYSYMPWVLQNGGELFNKDYSKFTFNTPATIGGLQFFMDMIHKYKVMPNQDPLAFFVSGKAGMFLTSRWLVPSLRANSRFNWDVALLPQGKKKSTLVYTSGYGISSKTKNPEAAWKLVKILTGTEAQKLYAQTGLVVPAGKKIATSDEFLKSGQKPDNNKAFVDTLAFGYPAYKHIKWFEINLAIDTGLELVISGQKELDNSVISDIEKKVNLILK